MTLTVHVGAGAASAATIVVVVVVVVAVGAVVVDGASAGSARSVVPVVVGPIVGFGEVAMVDVGTAVSLVGGASVVGAADVESGSVVVVDAVVVVVVVVVVDVDVVDGGSVGSAELGLDAAEPVALSENGITPAAAIAATSQNESRRPMTLIMVDVAAPDVGVGVQTFENRNHLPPPPSTRRPLEEQLDSSEATARKTEHEKVVTAPTAGCGGAPRWLC